MPKFDYSATIKTAQRLISNTGRPVTFVQFNPAATNPAEPWNVDSDPRTGATTIDVDAVFVEPSSVVLLGQISVTEDLLKRTEKIMIVSPGFAVDLKPSNIVEDGGTEWKIEFVRTLEPGDGIVLNYVGVRR